MINEINVDKLNTLLTQSATTKAPILLFDCREDFEWNESHVECAIHVPLNDFTANAPKLIANHSEPIYVICRSGRRSMAACLALLSLGYKHIYNVEGGILAWIEKGYPVV